MRIKTKGAGPVTVTQVAKLSITPLVHRIRGKETEPKPEPIPGDQGSYLKKLNWLLMAAALTSPFVYFSLSEVELVYAVFDCWKALRDVQLCVRRPTMCKMSSHDQWENEKRPLKTPFRKCVIWRNMVGALVMAGWKVSAEEDHGKERGAGFAACMFSVQGCGPDHVFMCKYRYKCLSGFE